MKYQYHNFCCGKSGDIFISLLHILPMYIHLHTYTLTKSNSQVHAHIFRTVKQSCTYYVQHIVQQSIILCTTYCTTIMYNILVLIFDYSRKLTPICCHAYRVNRVWEEAENRWVNRLTIEPQTFCGLKEIELKTRKIQRKNQQCVTITQSRLANKQRLLATPTR